MSLVATNITSFLTAGNNLVENAFLMSPAQNYYAILTSEGNLNVYFAGPSGPQLSWSSKTPAQSQTCVLKMQADGNVCIYAGDTLVFQTATAGQTRFLVMQSDGNLCVYNGTDPSNQGAFQWGSLQNGGRQF